MIVLVLLGVKEFALVAIATVGRQIMSTNLTSGRRVSVAATVAIGTGSFIDELLAYRRNAFTITCF